MLGLGGPGGRSGLMDVLTCWAEPSALRLCARFQALSHQLADTGPQLNMEAHTKPDVEDSSPVRNPCGTSIHVSLDKCTDQHLSALLWLLRLAKSPSV